jgi:hypothetical protein
MVVAAELVIQEVLEQVAILATLQAEQQHKVILVVQQVSVMQAVDVQYQVLTQQLAQAVVAQAVLVEIVIQMVLA